MEATLAASRSAGPVWQRHIVSRVVTTLSLCTGVTSQVAEQLARSMPRHISKSELNGCTVAHHLSLQTSKRETGSYDVPCTLLLTYRTLCLKTPPIHRIVDTRHRSFATIMSFLSKILRSSDGCEIYAEATGNPRNPHVVFVHGLSFSGAVFDEFCRLPTVLDRLYVVRYDLRGHGRSGKPTTPEGHVSAAYAADFMAVVKGFGLNKPVYVGCHSSSVAGSGLQLTMPPAWKGTMAVDVCANAQDIPISGIFYLASCPSMLSLVNGSAKPALLSVMGLSADPATATPALLSLVDRSFEAPRAQPIPFQMRCLYAGMQMMQPPEVRQAIGARQHDVNPFWKALQDGLPVFLYHGTYDVFLDGKAVEKDLKAHARDLEVKFVDDGGHGLYWEDPDETASVIIEFVTRVSKRGE
ncbi:hypothetical protein EW146_g4342 [Bondarzewia mesenterica]|uniref:AB hydrolase-1 domain-containing protein n=1 Tax=Bondarzewia mesenterica TaxID=1095465 RepID=A0A4S4LVY9_9AGAM|nr:hypothetical protein EW146_g4342 [Bondarzewia mesenterica]